MIKGISMVLGVGLVLLWMAGLASGNASPWLTWMDGCAGVLAFVLAGNATPDMSRSTRIGGALALGLGLFGLWIIGLAARTTPWLSWWTFAFGCSFLILALAAGSERKRIEPEMRIRKSA